MLRTRSPLRPKPAFDLHVLSMPPTFILSQDQTLRKRTELVLRPQVRTWFSVVAFTTTLLLLRCASQEDDTSTAPALCQISARSRPNKKPSPAPPRGSGNGLDTSGLLELLRLCGQRIRHVFRSVPQHPTCRGLKHVPASRAGRVSILSLAPVSNPSARAPDCWANNNLFP